MDVFDLARELLGDMPLTSSQLAQLRAINTAHYLRVHELLRTPQGPEQERDLTDEENATLRRVMVEDIFATLSPEQRARVAGPPG